MTTNGHKKAITRHRDHLSCIECRRKKLKCDRAAPCSACTRRDGGVSCSYQRATTGFEAERDRRKKAEGRLEHLEQLVQKLSKANDQAGPLSNGTESSNALTNPPCGGGSSSGNGTPNGTHMDNDAVYNGGTHWSAMLEDIEELRSAISMPTVDSESSPSTQSDKDDAAVDDAAIVFGGGPTLTFEQVLTQYLPPRQEADRLVATYLRSKAVKAPFLHPHQFQRLYQSFWIAPLTVPVLWASIMFSVFHASATSLGASATPWNKHAIGAAHCLAIGKHHQPRPYVVEALLLFAQTKCFSQMDVTPDIGSLLGLATRAAIRMGYHRDPARLPISIFEKEMRRRVWSALLQLELLISFQLGLPSSILPGSHDTNIPVNLQDADLEEDAVAMPPARPETEETDIMFYIAKHRLSNTFERIHQHVSTLAIGDAYDRVLVDGLDTEMRQKYLALPLQYRQKPVSQSVFDSPTLIIARFCVNLIYEKCLCVLHRPYVAAGRRESVLACYTASSNIIAQIVDAYYEFQPGGQVEMQRWFMSAITWHDLLLGATALCLVLCSARRHGLLVDVDVRGSVELLERARAVLARHSAQSRDTYQVEGVVKTVLARFDQVAAFSGPASAPVSNDTSAPTTNGSSQALFDDAMGPGMDLGWLSTFSQPMVDESWNWLESFLQEDFGSHDNGGLTAML